jgi:DNA-binding MarR family transcriptional regulator
MPRDTPLVAHEDPGADAALVMDSLRRVVRALRAMGDDAARDLGVTAAQLFVLRQLAEQPGQSLGELARRTLTRESSVSEVVSRLVAAGLVDRVADPSDRRRIALTLTHEGSRVASRAPVTVQENLVRAFRSLTPAERRGLADGFEAWLAAAGLQDAPTTMFFEDGSAHGS